jgi:hypothetical protein
MKLLKVLKVLKIIGGYLKTTHPHLLTPRSSTPHLLCSGRPCSVLTHSYLDSQSQLISFRTRQEVKISFGTRVLVTKYCAESLKYG